MLKIFLILLLFSSSAFATQWRAGTGEQTLEGTSAAALIGTNSYNSIVKPLDNLFWNYCNEYLTYTSSATITVSKGACVVSNSGGTIRLFLMDSASTNLTSSNLDTGSLTANATYYIYSTAATNSSTSSTYYISASNTAPSGQTYYYQIGSFATDTNTQITNIITNSISGGNVSGVLVSKSVNVVYQASTDLWAGCHMTTGGFGQDTILYTGSISGSMTSVQECSNGNNSFAISCSTGWYIRKGDYYEFTGSNISPNCYVEPIGK